MPEAAAKKERKWKNKDALECQHIDGEWCTRYDCDCILKMKASCAYWMLKRKYAPSDKIEQKVVHNKTIQQVVDKQWPVVLRQLRILFADEDGRIAELKRQAEAKAREITIQRLSQRMRLS